MAWQQEEEGNGSVIYMPGALKEIGSMAFGYYFSTTTDVTTISFGGYQDPWNPTSIDNSAFTNALDVILWTDEDTIGSGRRQVWEQLENAVGNHTIIRNDSRIAPQQ